MTEQNPNPQVAPLLEGPRQTGSVEKPDGSVAIHEVTADGMKQVRISGPARPQKGYSSASDFHRQVGVAQPYEQADDVGKPENRVRRAAKATGKALLDAARLSRP
jgi:hypothetical protein